MKATKFLFLVLLGLLTLARAQPIPGESEQPGEEPQLTIEDVMSDLRDDQGVDRDDQLDPQACDPYLLEDLGDALMHKYFIISSLRTMAENVAKGMTGASPERQHVQLGLAYVSAKVLGIMSLLDGAAQGESRQFFEPSGPGGDGGGLMPGDTGQYAEGDTGDEGEGDNGGNDSENTYGGTGFAGMMRNRSGGYGGGGAGSGGEAEGYQGGGAEGRGGSGLAGVSRNRIGGAGGSGVGAGSYRGSANQGGSYQGRGGGAGALAMNERGAAGGGGQGSYPGRSGGGSYSGSYRGRGGGAGGYSAGESRGAPGGGGTRGASAVGHGGGRAVVGGPVGELVGQIANVRLILLVVALVVLGTITLTFIRIVRFFRKRARRHAGEQVAPVPIADPAMTLLKERFVKDEITREEFEKKKRELEEMSGTPAEPEHKHGHPESKPKPKEVGGEVMEP